MPSVTNTNGTTTAKLLNPPPGGRLAELVLDWTSHASTGTVDCVIKGVSGEIVGFETKPDGGGTAPTNLYDILLNDRHGVDLLAGGGANRSGTTAERISGFDAMTLRKAFHGSLTLAISNAGNSKGGLISIYILQ